MDQVSVLSYPLVILERENQQLRADDEIKFTGPCIVGKGSLCRMRSIAETVFLTEYQLKCDRHWNELNDIQTG